MERSSEEKKLTWNVCFDFSTNLLEIFPTRKKIPRY